MFAARSPPQAPRSTPAVEEAFRALSQGRFAMWLLRDACSLCRYGDARVPHPQDSETRMRLATSPDSRPRAKCAGSSHAVYVSKLGRDSLRGAVAFPFRQPTNRNTFRPHHTLESPRVQHCEYTFCKHSCLERIPFIPLFLSSFLSFGLSFFSSFCLFIYFA